MHVKQLRAAVPVLALLLALAMAALQMPAVAVADEPSSDPVAENTNGGGLQNLKAPILWNPTPWTRGL